MKRQRCGRAGGRLAAGGAARRRAAAGGGHLRAPIAPAATRPCRRPPGRRCQAPPPLRPPTRHGTAVAGGPAPRPPRPPRRAGDRAMRPGPAPGSADRRRCPPPPTRRPPPAAMAQPMSVGTLLFSDLQDSPLFRRRAPCGRGGLLGRIGGAPAAAACSLAAANRQLQPLPTARPLACLQQGVGAGWQPGAPEGPRRQAHKGWCGGCWPPPLPAAGRRPGLWHPSHPPRLPTRPASPPASLAGLQKVRQRAGRGRAGHLRVCRQART